jgi:pilus assembly protein CpaE
MQERAACVIIVGSHPALDGLPAALAALDLDVVRTVQPEEVASILQRWAGSCVAVLDVSLPDSDAFASIHRLLHLAPDTPTLVVFDERYTASPRDLAPRDAIGQLPLTTHELVAEVVALLRRVRVDVALPDVPSAQTTPLDGPADAPAPPDGPQGQAIAVIALKGGVGRSTIAANLAVALARWHGKRIILVDADLWRGDVGVLLNLPFGRGMADLVPPPDEVLDLEKVQGALRSHPSGVRLLPAPADPTLVEGIPALLPARLVDVCKGLADYVIVDTPPALDDLTLHVLDVADRVLGVLVPEVSAVRHTSRLLRLAPHLQLVDRLALVLNRANSGLSTQQLEALLGRPVDARIVSAGLKVLQAANWGTTLVDGELEAADGIARDFARLAALVAGEPAPPEMPRTRRRGFSLPIPGLRRATAPKPSG